MKFSDDISNDYIMFIEKLMMSKHLENAVS